MSVALVIITGLVSVGLGLGPTIGLSDLLVVSVAGGALASLPVLAATLGLAGGEVRFGWDRDNVTAPLVSSIRDVLNTPAAVGGTGCAGCGPGSTGERDEGK